MDITQFLMDLSIIIMIDLVLGGDNAIVIALATRNLPAQQRNKGILIGTGLAILVRVIFTFFAVWLLQIPYLMLIGGLFLIWVALKLLIEDKKEKEIKAEHTLGAAIRTIVVADVVMGVDNILAIAGAAKGSMLLVVLGLIISVPIIIFGSKLILALLDRYPLLIYIGAGVLAFTAGNMIIHDQRMQGVINQFPYLTWLIPGIIIAFVIGYGMYKNRELKAKTK